MNKPKEIVLLIPDHLPFNQGDKAINAVLAQYGHLVIEEHAPVDTTMVDYRGQVYRPIVFRLR